MTYHAKDCKDVRKIIIQEGTQEGMGYRVSVHFKPDDGMGAGRMAYVHDGDLIEYVEKIQGWIHIRAIVFEDMRNTHQFDGWIRNLPGISFSRGNCLDDVLKDRQEDE